MQSNNLSSCFLFRISPEKTANKNTSISSITPSISFPSQLQSQSFRATFPTASAATVTNQPPQKPTALDNDFLNSFMSVNLGSNSTNRTPMNQMMNTSPSTNIPNTMNNFMLSPMSTSNAINKTKSSNENTVSLSAQEINDFLS